MESLIYTRKKSKALVIIQLPIFFPNFTRTVMVIYDPLPPCIQLLHPSIHLPFFSLQIFVNLHNRIKAKDFP